MKWVKKECNAGDMIRIAIGKIHHYGVFVSENEVIQFGEPPIGNLVFRDNSLVKVCRATIDEFSNGFDVEVAVEEDGDNLTKRSADEIVNTARSRIGEGGYSIIHNNCEHFAYECVYGVRCCTQTDDMRMRWRERPILSLYIKKIPRDLKITTLYPPERDSEVQNAKSDKVKREKLSTWSLLEYALCDTFSKDIKKLNFTKNEFGKWSADGVFFSLSHCDGYVGVAVSNKAVGIDIENLTDFESKNTADKISKMKKHILADDENDLPVQTGEDFLSIWTKKESIFKCYKTGYYHPSEIRLAEYNTKSKKIKLDDDLFLSFCGECLGSEKIYYLDNDNHKSAL